MQLGEFTVESLAKEVRATERAMRKPVRGPDLLGHLRSLQRMVHWLERTPGAKPRLAVLQRQLMAAIDALGAVRGALDGKDLSPEEPGNAGEAYTQLLGALTAASQELHRVMP